jgi:general stress protein 26
MMTDVASFSDIEAEFQARVSRIVWCTVATVDRRGRPRTRILHPIWEGATGWIATGRETLKTRHLEHNPYVSLCYWDQQHQQVYADCLAEWDDDMAQKRRVWDLYKNTPPPLGYDPGMIWQSGVEDPTYGLLKLTPWRIELYALGDLISGKDSQVWHSAEGKG